MLHKIYLSSTPGGKKNDKINWTNKNKIVKIVYLGYRLLSTEYFQLDSTDFYNWLTVRSGDRKRYKINGYPLWQAILDHTKFL